MKRLVDSSVYFGFRPESDETSSILKRVGGRGRSPPPSADVKSSSPTSAVEPEDPDADRMSRLDLILDAGPVIGAGGVGVEGVGVEGVGAGGVRQVAAAQSIADRSSPLLRNISPPPGWASTVSPPLLPSSPTNSSPAPISLPPFPFLSSVNSSPDPLLLTRHSPTLPHPLFLILFLTFPS
jgi:hypothetical protein